MNMAIFISPGYFSDYAWLKITDSALATKILADGRTTVHPAQTRVGVGESKYESRYCNPFTMGASNSDHLIRFYDFINVVRVHGMKHWFLFQNFYCFVNLIGICCTHFTCFL